MRKFGAALALVGPAALTACGGAKQYDTVPAREVIAAASTTQTVPSERIHQEATTKGGAQTVHLTADGAFDNKRKVGRATLDLSGAPGDQRG